MDDRPELRVEEGRVANVGFPDIEVVADTLEDMNPQFPPAEEGLDKVVIGD